MTADRQPSAELNTPMDIALDAAGNVYIAEISKQSHSEDNHLDWSYYHGCRHRDRGIFRRQWSGDKCGAFESSGHCV